MSAIPATLDALFALGASLLAPDGWQVIDGPPLQNVERDVLGVGYDPGDDEAVQGVEEDTGWALDQRAENFDVTLWAEVWLGDTGMKAARDRVFAARDAISDALKADPELGGAVMTARLGPLVAYDQSQNESGAFATLRFSVRCTAHT